MLVYSSSDQREAIATTTKTNTELRKRLADAEPSRRGDVVRDQLKTLPDEITHSHAVTVGFTTPEGTFHTLDYDRVFLAESADGGLTFDGSSIRGFTNQGESDLRLGLDWNSIRWMPPMLTGGQFKPLIFANVIAADGTPYPGDPRSLLSGITEKLCVNGEELRAACEVEGFLVEGACVEQKWREGPFVGDPFNAAANGGYFNTLPGGRFHQYIDSLAAVLRAMGYKMEKDHPEVAGAQFELNWAHEEALMMADMVLLYKLAARQVANNIGCTATFLPKPFADLNGSGMHTNLSKSSDGSNLFWSADGESNLADLGWDYVGRILARAEEMCLAFSSSVNAYRRLDPTKEAPNQIFVSPRDRGAMIRIPLFGSSKAARIEIRAIAPDCSPHLVFALLELAGADASMSVERESIVREAGKAKHLPATISDAIPIFADSSWIKKVLPGDLLGPYVELKTWAANRSPRVLGKRVKSFEVLDHHEITNQKLRDLH